MTLRIRIIICLVYPLLLSASGWSPAWEEGTNNLHRPTAREFMELVWAVNERVIAAKSAARPFYRTARHDSMDMWLPDKIWPFNENLYYENLYYENADYLIVETNWNGYEDIVTTSALYRAEFWRPNKEHIDSLIFSAYHALSYFSPISTNGPNVPWGDYANPLIIDPNVPYWVYYEAAELAKKYPTNAYLNASPLYLWQENPVTMFGGTIEYDGAKPFPKIKYPIIDGTENVHTQVFKMFFCVPGDEGTYELSPPYSETYHYNESFDEWFGPANYKTDTGVYSCDKLVASWDSSGPWTNTVISFDVHVAETTNIVGPWWFTDESYAHPILPANYPYFLTDYGVNKTYSTNTIQISGTLPLDIPCPFMVPLNIEITGGGSFTQRVPGVTVTAHGLDIAAKHDYAFNVPYGYRDEIRGDYYSWQTSWSTFKKIKEMLDRYDTMTVKVGYSLVEDTSYRTNNTTTNYLGGGECEDVVLPIGYGEFWTNYNYTAYENEVWDYGSGEWVPGTCYGKPTKYFLNSPDDYHESVNAYLFGESDDSKNSQRIKANASFYKYAAFPVVDRNYTTKLLSYDYGYPRIDEYSLYLAKSEHYVSDPYMPTGMLLYVTNVFVPPLTSLVRFNYDIGMMGAATVITDPEPDRMAYYIRHLPVAYGNCRSDSTNRASKEAYMYERFRATIVAKWVFTTNFDEYWDYYPAATNEP